MFQCTECYLTKTELGIRFQQPSLMKTLYFLILTIYLSNLDQVLLPTQQRYLLYITIKLKHIFKILPVNFMNNFHVGNAFCPDLITKPLSRMQSLSESRRGSKVTKPIFSNQCKALFRPYFVCNDAVPCSSKLETRQYQPSQNYNVPFTFYPCYDPPT